MLRHVRTRGSASLRGRRRHGGSLSRLSSRAWSRGRGSEGSLPCNERFPLPNAWIAIVRSFAVYATQDDTRVAKFVCRGAPTARSESLGGNCRDGNAKAIPQRRSRRMIATHSVNSATGRSRRRAQVNTWQRSAIRRGTQDGTREHLPEIWCTAANVAADQVRIALFQLARA